MTDPRDIAAALMRKAQNDTSPSQRGQQHGDLEKSFTMIADLWNVYLRHKTLASGLDVAMTVPIDAVDVLEMMSLLKKARNVYGAPIVDHSADDIGYTGLAGGLRLSAAVDGKVQEEINGMMKEPEYKSVIKPIPEFLRQQKSDTEDNHQ